MFYFGKDENREECPECHKKMLLIEDGTAAKPSYSSVDPPHLVLVWVCDCGYRGDSHISMFDLQDMYRMKWRNINQ